MSHEAILYGRIIGATRQPGADYFALHALNRAVLNRFPWDDDWPWLVRGMFALPAGHPQGTFRRQVIHFGASIKDAPENRDIWDEWLGKFEALLTQLYWWSAVVHLSTDFEPDRVFEWRPTDAAMAGLYAELPRPIGDWVRSVRTSE
ncbi:MAG: hypothetical protein K8U57_12240 [Planctomycetes bacterium]|nr:hypothetical protein [Planctomycetota bacterium]